MYQPPKILAVIVTYFPEADLLQPLVSRLKDQVDTILVVDNTPSQDDRIWPILLPHVHHEQLRLVRFGENLGIAAALNVGIQLAATEGFTHVLLSDQDSLPAIDMVSGLLLAESEMRQKGLKVGATGPVYEDEITGMRFPFQVQESGKLFYSHRQVDEHQPHLQTLSLITSGALISVSVLREVGEMREDFFIDYVDVEWCHRAHHFGYALIGTAYAKMAHRMGDDSLPVWVFGWRRINGYGPLRLYYRFRNFAYLLRLAYVPLRWKIRSSWYWLGNFYAHALFAPQRCRCTMMMLRGMRDGLLGKMGKLVD